MRKIISVVITYNRKKLLVECIKCLLNQSTLPSQVLIIDNASTDGTENYLRSQGFFENHLIQYCRLFENCGGSGGFAEGIKLALQYGADWVWLMDDDAMPEFNALEKLLQFPVDEHCVYGTSALGGDGEHLCWPAKTSTGQILTRLTDLHVERTSVTFQPFLGFLISRKLVEKAGLPDSGFFLSGDDVDYCLRITHLGGKIYLCRDSRLRHPMPARKSIDILGFKVAWLIQSPERAYYNIRNKVIISRRYYGYKLWTLTLPGIVTRLLMSLIYGPNRSFMLRVYLYAILHGLFGKLGSYTLSKKQ